MDGSRPAVAWVAALPREYALKMAERYLLQTLACDSYDGRTTSPSMEDLADWLGVHRSALYRSIEALEKPTEHRPALLRRERRGRRTTFVLLSPMEPEPAPWEQEEEPW